MMDETATMQELQADDKTLADYLAAIKRRKLPLFAVMAAVFICIAAIAILLPAVYKSSAIILIEQQEIPQDLVRTTVTSYADQRVQIISQRVMTTSNMKQIIDKYDLYAEQRKDDPLEVILDQMRDDISLDMISADVFDPRTGRAAKATIAFSLSYTNESPKLAQKVTNELVSLFLNENLRNRTEMAEDANQFLQDEVDRLGERVNKLEKKVARFKQDNAGSLPEMVKLNREMMDREERELTEMKRRIQTLQERRIYLESELSQLSPLTASFSETGERILGPRDRLKILETRYITLSSRYSAVHPDVMKLQDEIEALKQEIGSSEDKNETAMRLKEARLDLLSLQKKYATDHPEVKKTSRLVLSLEQDLQQYTATKPDRQESVKPDNPAFIQLQTQLEATGTELAGLQESEKLLRDKIAMYEERLSQSPDVEREFRALLREYENEVLKFKEMKAKQMEAQLAENLETENKGERFTLIEPPLLPVRPDKPNRMALLALAVVAALGAGFGSVTLVENLDRSVYGRKGVERLVGELPLTVVPYIETPAEAQRRRQRYVIIVLALLLSIVVLLLAIHFFFKPLDVLWFVLLRKFGLN